jgi:hypothetical protein
LQRARLRPIREDLNELFVLESDGHRTLLRHVTSLECDDRGCSTVGWQQRCLRNDQYAPTLGGDDGHACVHASLQQLAIS